MIHQYQLGGYNIVLDVCSGSVHAVDDIAYDMIALFEGKGREEIVAAMLAKYGTREGVTRKDLEECYDQILSLAEKGKLLRPTPLSRWRAS